MRGVRLKEYVDMIAEERQRELSAAMLTQKELIEQVAVTARRDRELLRDELSERITALRRERVAATEAQKQAVLKSEIATEKRFESVNEWRAQSTDRERTRIEEGIRLTASFVLREVADAQHLAMQNAIEGILVALADMRSRLDRTAGERAGVASDRSLHLRIADQRIQVWAIIATVAIGLLSAAVVIAVATHGFTT